MKRNEVAMAALMGLVTVCVTSSWLSADALNVKLHGINYDFRQGPDWDGQRCKGEYKVAREIKYLQTITNRVRIYSLSDCNVRQVLRTANETGMTVWVGVWVSNHTSAFREELSILKALISEGLITEKLIDGINVGSEVLYRNDTTADVLINNFNSVKMLIQSKNLNIPLSITDTLGMLVKHPEVVKVQDILTFNQFPFWNKVAVKSAAKDFESSIASFSNITSSKPFIITETGWAAGGYDDRASDASPENAALYMKDFVTLAMKKGWKYYYFAGFDTPYRKTLNGQKDSVEAYFGIFNASGAINTFYDGLTIDATNATDGLTIPLNKTTPAPTPKASSASRNAPLWLCLLAFVLFPVV